MNTNVPTPNNQHRASPIQRHNKRSATSISSYSPLPSSDSDTPNVSGDQYSNHVDNYTFHHHIQQTFLGPICTACGHKVANGNILFDISRNSIKNHMTTNKCFSGDLALFKPKELEKALRTAMIHLHNSIRDNLSLASRMVENKYNFVQSVKNFPYCAQCGFVGTKLCHVRRHAKSQSTVCSESDVRPADGTIRTNEYGFLIPSVVLDKIGRGLFILPTKRCRRSNVPMQLNTPIIPPAQHPATTI